MTSGGLVHFLTRSSGKFQTRHHQHLIDGSHRKDGRAPLGDTAHHAQPAGTDPRPRRVHHRRRVLQGAAARRRRREHGLPQAGHQQGARHRHRRRVVGGQGAADRQARAVAVGRWCLVPRLPARDEQLPHLARLQRPQRLPLQHLRRDGACAGPECRHHGARAQLQRPRQHGRPVCRRPRHQRRDAVQRERPRHAEPAVPAGGRGCARRREQGAADPGHLAAGRHGAVERVHGLQLPPRLAHAHLHDHARGGRQADPVWVRLRLRAQPGSGAADGLLLERPVDQDEGQAEGGPGSSGVFVCHDDLDTEERADDPSPWLGDRSHNGLLCFWFSAPAGVLFSSG